MRTAPKIESSNLSIADLFRDFYSVPDFQREYVWQKSNVERLLSDIYYELYEEDVTLDDAEYFLGSIVVFRDEDKTFQLIDGQQRLTTIYLVFCVVRNLIVDLGSQSRALDDLIAGVTQDMKTGEDVSRYHRYYIMSHYNVDLKNNFPEEDIYNWFVEQESYHRINQDPLKFVDELIKASQHYRMFTEGKNTDSSHNRYLGNIKKLQGGYSQHFILLLAGRHLEKDLFAKLCEQVENLLFIYTFIRKGRGKDFNLTRVFSQWSEKLRLIKNSEQLSNFIEEHFKKAVHSWSSEFETLFKGLTESDIAKFRLRYILAKLSQFVDEEVYSSYKPLSSYLAKSIHIEHILPQSRKIQLIDGFDKPEKYENYVKKLGNLTLLENSINSSISNNSYELKKQGYRHSQMLITRSLVEKPNVGSNTQINRGMKNLELEQYDDWTSDSIDKRQDRLVSLAKKVWGLSS
ncbi:MAG: DUF262 domain-containing HNH endonuclease family protein [Spirulinaceae cyanobacterium]